MAFYLGSGSKAQDLHRDDQCHYTRHPAKSETEIGIMFAGTKSHRANGATNVVPGSNHWDDHRKSSLEEAVPAELEKGDALMWYDCYNLCMLLWRAGFTEKNAV
ncbi:hypothetical protein BDW69DRAFT_189235 [Aspergillus filifer]